MSRRTEALPAGYERFRFGDSLVVSLEPLAAVIREALAAGTLYDYAARHPKARPLVGRGTAYAVPLPDAMTPVVVRRSRHGGLLGPLTGDRFLAPTRAPRELLTARRLAQADVPTPEIVAFATYPVGHRMLSPLRRSDVATREVVGGRDLAAALLQPTWDRRTLWAATAHLIASMAHAGARHPDLNLKNVLIAAGSRSTGAVVALVLDVDRIVFGRPGDPAIARANVDRLTRSARRWHERYGAAAGEEDLRWLRSAALDLTAVPRRSWR